MDDDRQVLEEIRDLTKRHLDLATREAERCRLADDTRRADMAEMKALATAQGRLYKRVVLSGAIVVVGLLIFLFSYVVTYGRR